MRFDENVLDTTETALPVHGARSGGGGGGGGGGGSARSSSTTNGGGSGGGGGHVAMFRTETGMPVASISEREQGDLHSVASDMGLLRIQSVETAGLSVAQMVIGILGGARRT